MSVMQDIYTTDQFIQLLKYDPYILDIRTVDEYCSGHLCGSINIVTPVPPLSSEALSQLEQDLAGVCIRGRDSPIIVYCKRGKRAGISKNILHNLGYTNVLSMGGIEDEPLKSIMSGLDYRFGVCRCQPV